MINYFVDVFVSQFDFEAIHVSVNCPKKHVRRSSLWIPESVAMTFGNAGQLKNRKHYEVPNGHEENRNNAMLEQHRILIFCVELVFDKQSQDEKEPRL